MMDKGTDKWKESGLNLRRKFEKSEREKKVFQTGLSDNLTVEMRIRNILARLSSKLLIDEEIADKIINLTFKKS